MYGLPAIYQPDVLNLHVLSLLIFAQRVEPGLEELCAWDRIGPAAEAHHVLLRTELALKNLFRNENTDIACLLSQERSRVAAAVDFLFVVCKDLPANGVPVVVIKSLDHWPDFGSDIDLFTDAPEPHVSALMRSLFDAETVTPTLGDRIAGKVNYRVPGLRELVEIHFGRLGQTGEHIELARRVMERHSTQIIGGNLLPLPAPEERISLAVLQRMYRHFYIRLCDIANTARIVESEQVDFDELRHTSKQAGIWPGVATYLKLVSQYLEHYRGYGLRLPMRVHHAARFGLKKVYPHAGFLRLPLFPQAASLFTRQFAKSVRRDPAAGLRLTLLPPMAVAAGARYKITGSDKGVW